MNEMSRVVEKSNIQNSVNSTGNSVHYICKEWLDLKKNRISRVAKIQRKIVYVIYVRNVWIIKKLNVQSCKNSMENNVRYICMECMD